MSGIVISIDKNTETYTWLLRWKTNEKQSNYNDDRSLRITIFNKILGMPFQAFQPSKNSK